MINKVLKKICVLIIDCYKYGISPFLPHSCRFLPTCSVYTKQAIEQYGVKKGIIQGAKRLIKCHPWGNSGYDPA